MTALVTVDDIRQYLTINSNVGETTDANLSTLANMASSAVESYCGRKFTSAFVIEIHDGGRTSIFINRPPVNNVNSIAQYNGNQYVPLIGTLDPTGERPNVSANANAVIQYVLYPEIGQFSREVNFNSGSYKLGMFPLATFNNYSRGVRVEYNGGYDIIPEDLKMVTLDFVKILHKDEQSSGSVSFQGESKSQFPITSSNFPPHIKRTLDFYRII